MRTNCASQRGFSIVEIAIVIAVIGLVTGLIMEAVIETQRTSTALQTSMHMRQQALVIEAQVKRTLRYHLSAEDLLSPELRGGAAPQSAAGGTTQTMPASLTTTVLRPESEAPQQNQVTAAAAGQTTAPASTTVPVSVRGLLTTETLPQNLQTTPAAESISGRFQPDLLEIASLAQFEQSGQLRYSITTQREPDSGLSRVIVAPVSWQAGQAGGAEGENYSSDITFRYAEEVRDFEAVWTDSPANPRLVEYTIRVWPARFATFDTAVEKSGRPLGYTLVSAAALK